MSRQQPTVGSIKNVANNKDNIKLMTSLFQAMAYRDTLKDIIKPKQQQIVDFYKFKTSEKVLEMYASKGASEHIDKYIKDPDKMYKASDEDFHIYLAELEKFYYSNECPVKPREKGNCPLLEADSMVRNIERMVIDIIAPQVGINGENLTLLKHRKAFLDLTLTLFANKVKNSLHRV